jgi:hypothetical protein
MYLSTFYACSKETFGISAGMVLDDVEIAPDDSYGTQLVQI